MSASKGTFIDGVKDNLDGSYTQNLNLPTGMDERDVDITVGVRGEDLTFNLAEKIGGRYGISLHLGRAVPKGNFNNDYDPGYSMGVNVEYRLSPHFLVQGLIAYNHFDAGSSSVSDTYWWNISANLKYEIMTTPLRPYFLGGAGIYIPKSGSTEPGYNIGIGLEYLWSPRWTVEVGVDYNQIFTSGSDTKVVVPQVGVIYRF
jgi:opacity protein-like surface antigen